MANNSMWKNSIDKQRCTSSPRIGEEINNHGSKTSVEFSKNLALKEAINKKIQKERNKKGVKGLSILQRNANISQSQVFNSPVN